MAMVVFFRWRCQWGESNEQWATFLFGVIFQFFVSDVFFVNNIHSWSACPSPRARLTSFDIFSCHKLHCLGEKSLRNDECKYGKNNHSCFNNLIPYRTPLFLRSQRNFQQFKNILVQDYILICHFPWAGAFAPLSYYIRFIDEHPTPNEIFKVCTVLSISHHLNNEN